MSEEPGAAAGGRFGVGVVVDGDWPPPPWPRWLESGLLPFALPGVLLEPGDCLEPPRFCELFLV